MFRCHICNEIFTKTVTNYPDEKNPCPDCVGAYKEMPELEDEPDAGEVSLDELDSNDSSGLVDGAEEE